MLIPYARSQTSVILRVKIRDSSEVDGRGLTGLTNASSGLIISTIADNEATATTYTVTGSTIETIATLGTYAAPTATKCRFKEVDSTNHKGVYEIQLANARFAVSNAKSLLVSILGATDAAECDVLIPLTDTDPYTADPTAVTIADAVWDEDIVAAHNTADTAGAILDDLLTPANFKATGFSTHTAAAVADAVLDEAMADHTSAGSLGLFLNDIYDVQITGITAGVEGRAGKHSAAAVAMISTNSAINDDGNLVAKKPSDDSTFQTYTITTDASANNFTGIS